MAAMHGVTKGAWCLYLNRSAPWVKPAYQPGRSCWPRCVCGPSTPVTCSSPSCVLHRSLMYHQHQHKIAPWITWEHKLKVEVQEPPSAFVSFCAMISKGLVSQVSSWTEVHREGKQRQSPGPHFLLYNLFGLLVLQELLFCSSPLNSY